MADIIKVEHLSYIYNPGMPNAVTALDDVSFTVEEGDFVGIIGATGSGKSTLIKMCIRDRLWPRPRRRDLEAGRLHL